MTVKPKVIEFYGKTPDEASGYVGELDFAADAGVIISLQDEYGDSIFENFKLGDDLDSALSNLEGVIEQLEEVKAELEKAIAREEKAAKKK